MFARLLKVGSMAGSMSVYLPAVVLQRLIAIGRVFLFVYLMPLSEFGLWGLGAMLFSVAGPILGLGSHLALARYVSYYEAQGLLERFHRHVRWGALIIVGATGVAAFALSNPIADFVISVKSDAGAVSHHQRLLICWAALANAMLLAWYQNLQSFMLGLRVYRLTSLVEVFYAVLFTAVAAAALMVQPAALTLLLAHAATLIATLALGAALLHAAMPHLAAAAATPPDAPALPDAGGEAPEVAGAMPLTEAPKPRSIDRTLVEILHFGLVALVGSIFWMVAQNVSFYLTSQHLGHDEGGRFYAYSQFGQLIVFLSNAAWAVVFSHVARRWEGDSREVAMFVLETAYRAVAIAMMTLTIMGFATKDIWVRLLPNDYQKGLPVLGGLLMLYQVVTNLAIMTILANLRRQPVLIAAAALAGGAANVVLVLYLAPQRAGGIAWAEWASWAAGIGMYVGGGAVAVAYFLLARIRLHACTLAILASPALLLLLALPRWSWIVPAVWACVLAAAFGTNWLFNRQQKRILRASLRRLLAGGKGTTA